MLAVLHKARGYVSCYRIDAIVGGGSVTSPGYAKFLTGIWGNTHENQFIKEVND
jgi:hypothetical protein